MTGVIAYLRVSSESQLSGYGLQVQQGNVQRWVEASGNELIGCCTDEGVQGTLDAPDRPGLTEVLSRLSDGEADGLVVASLDRLSRALHVQEAVLGRVWSQGGRVFAADHGEVLADDPDDPMRTAMRQMAGVFAQLDRAMLVKRMRDGRRIKASQGGHAHGRYAYGTSKAGPVPAELQALSLMRQSRPSLPWHAVASLLNVQGPPPRSAACWTPANTRKVGRLAGMA